MFHAGCQIINCLQLSKSICGTPQYMHNMNLDVVAKVRAFNINTFFLTVSWTELERPEIIQVVAQQYSTILSDEDILNMTFEQKSMWLKTKLVERQLVERDFV